MRVQIKNTTIFGNFLGIDKKGKAIVVEEETNKIKKYCKTKLKITNEKGV
jgi:hypothetical protein